MKKQIIKCDKCGKVLDYENSTEKEHQYYSIEKEFIEGWIGVDLYFGRNSTFQICEKCFDLLEINKKVGKKKVSK